MSNTVTVDLKTTEHKHRVVSIKTIWLMFAIFMVLFIANLFIDIPMTPSNRMNLVFFAWLIIMSVMLLKKHGFPKMPAIIISVILAGVAGVSVIIAIGQSDLLGGIVYFVITLFAALAMFSVSRTFSNSSFHILNRKGKGGIILSVLLGVGVGIIFGAVNYFFMQQGQTPDIQVTLPRVVFALEPAIVEEIAMRALFFSFCISAVNGEGMSKVSGFTTWFMMVVPHAIMHTPDIFIANGPIAGLINTLLLVLIFGLPLAILQRKRDITSAMIAHGLIDLIRFCAFGLPM